MHIELEPTEDMVGIVTVSEPEFTLQANEEKMVEYTVTVAEPGYYAGSILVKAQIEGRGKVGYNADLAMFVREGDLKPYFYAGVALLVLVAVLVFVFFIRRASRKPRKRPSKKPVKRPVKKTSKRPAKAKRSSRSKRSKR
jgi:hypothetical protein